MAKLYYGDANNTAVEINLGGSDGNAIQKDGSTVTTNRIPFDAGISTDSITFNENININGINNPSLGIQMNTDSNNIRINNGKNVINVKNDAIDIFPGNSPTVGDVLTATSIAGTVAWRTPSGLNYTPDVWVFSIPSSQGTSPYAYYYTESADTPQYRKTNATFETISEHWCKLKLFFEVDCEEEKNAWPSLSPGIQAIVNAQSSTILSHYPGKSINYSYASPIYLWGGYKGTGSSEEGTVKTVGTDTLAINDLTITDENDASVGWQIPDSVIPSGTNYVTTYGFWEYWIRLD